MNMRISEQYFQEMLDSPRQLQVDSSAVSKAVFYLDRQWCARESVSKNKPNFGLSQPEFTVNLCIRYLGEIYNGGHSQFFSNPSGASSPDILVALERVGLSDIQTILKQACAVFPDTDIPFDQETREEVVEAMSEEQYLVWRQLDKQLYTSDRDVWNVLLTYIRENEEQILRPERGMTTT